MTHHSHSKWAAIALIAAACALGGCGRKGSLDLPPSATSAQAQADPNDPNAVAASSAEQSAVAQGNVFDPTPGGNRLIVAPRGPKKRIILDPLLD